jgi:hypothetical protein
MGRQNNISVLGDYGFEQAAMIQPGSAQQQVDGNVSPTGGSFANVVRVRKITSLDEEVTRSTH